MVLVDAVGRDDWRRGFASWPKSLASKLRRAWAEPITDGVDRRASAALASQIRTLGDTPLVVISAAREREQYAEFPPSLYRRAARFWRLLQTELASLSTDQAHVVALRSDHHIHRADEQPVVAIGAAVASYTPAGVGAGAYNKNLVASTMDIVTFSTDVRVVEVISDGSSDIMVSIDGADPTVGGSVGLLLPAGQPSVREIASPTVQNTGCTCAPRRMRAANASDGRSSSTSASRIASARAGTRTTASASRSPAPTTAPARPTFFMDDAKEGELRCQMFARYRQVRVIIRFVARGSTPWQCWHTRAEA